MSDARVLEALALALGLLYAVLAVRRNRFCFVGGALSSAILAFLAARARLPMQAVLQVIYVAMSVYGFLHWGRSREARPIGTWPLRIHLLAIAAVLVLGFLSAQWLAAETRAARPLLDATTMWASLLATWMVARVKLENWLYWIVIDLALAILFAVQALYIVALLYLAYCAIAVVGWFAWVRSWRAQTLARA